MTPHSELFWSRVAEAARRFLDSSFEDLSDTEIQLLWFHMDFRQQVAEEVRLSKNRGEAGGPAPAPVLCESTSLPRRSLPPTVLRNSIEVA